MVIQFDTKLELKAKLNYLTGYIPFRVSSRSSFPHKDLFASAIRYFTRNTGEEGLKGYRARCRVGNFSSRDFGEIRSIESSEHEINSIDRHTGVAR